MMIISILILLISIILHEIAHGYVAYLFGDSTAKDAGRLSVNPLVHIDPVGSLLLPGMTLFFGGGFFIGWAKPVPVNPINFKNRDVAMMWVALAGPLTNVSLAVFASVFLYLSLFAVFPVLIIFVLKKIIIINIVLAFFNLIPIPPLDGSRILARFLPLPGKQFLSRVEPYGILFVFLLVYMGGVTTYFTWVIPPFLRLLLPY